MPKSANTLALRDGALRTPWMAISAFLLPALIMYIAFTAYPVLRTFWNALHKVLPNGSEEWVGLANLQTILAGDPTFWKAVGNTLTWALIAPLLEVSLGLLLALALYARVPFARFFRVAWFTPVLISYVVVGILWVWIYNYDWGVANALLRFVGLDAWARAWLGNPSTALPALIFVTTWMWTGFNMVVLLAALSSLPSEVLEAAELDNCDWAKKLWFVIIPMVRPTILNLVVLSFIGKMKIFDLVWITTQGGPLWSTETVSTYVYKRAFEWSTFDLGYPSAIAAIWFAFVLTGVLMLTWLFRSPERLEY
jgi:multiple sugar transport system permease protein/raffinose/stachyose/melibiose transport system permease protein